MIRLPVHTAKVPSAGNLVIGGYFVTPKEIRNSTIRKNAFSLKDQEISQPFRVNLLEQKSNGSIGNSKKFAWYILKIENIEAAKQLPVDEVRPEIERIIAKELELEEAAVNGFLDRSAMHMSISISLLNKIDWPKKLPESVG